MSARRGSSLAGGVAPGELVYRIGGYASFFGEMTRALPAHTLTEGPYAGERPLRRLSPDGDEGWTAGLLQAWASVGEVLAFYQERIANEGYLSSAVEPLSLRELSRLVGHEPFPGVGAEGYVAFTLADVGPRQVELRGGARLASVPGGGRDAQSWETLEPAHLRRDWNALRPHIPLHRLEEGLHGASRCVLVSDPGSTLQRGTSLLIAAGEGDQQQCWIRTIEAVEAANEFAGDAGIVRLRWTEPLDPEDPSRVHEPLQLFTLSGGIKLFGNDAPDWNAVADQTKAGFARPEGGVITWSRSGWRSSNLGLDGLSVRALLARPDGSLLAATPNGVYGSRSGEAWERAGLDLTGIHVECLTAEGERTIYAGSAKQGVFRSVNGVEWEPLYGETELQPAIRVWRGRFRSGRLPGGPVRSLMVRGPRLYAGTDHGVFFYEAGPSTWRAASRGLPGWDARSAHAATVVYALAARSATGALIAGTDRGVFLADDEARRWQSRCDGLPHDEDDADRCDTAVFALLEIDDEELRIPHLFAGTHAGVFRSSGAEVHWRAVSLGLPNTDVDSGLSQTSVHALVATASPRSGVRRLLAATSNGIFYSDDYGDFWDRLDPGDPDADPPPPPMRPVTALTLDAHGAAVAGVPLGGFDRVHRPDYARADLGDGLDLAEATTRIRPARWAGLIPEDGSAARGFRIRAVDSVFRQSHLGPRRVTRLSPDRDLGAWLERHPKASLHLADGHALDVPQGDCSRVAPMAQAQIALREVDPACAFSASREVFVLGQRMRLRLHRSTSMIWEDGATSELMDAEEFLVTALRHDPQGVRLHVRSEHGRGATLQAAAARLQWVPARRGDEQVVERVRATWIAPGAPGEPPGLVFDPGLSNAFDPTTVKIQANVVRASQGRRIRVDLLGGGDSTRANQWFRFTAQPITFLRSSGPRGYRSSVEIRVNGLVWSEVDSLLDRGPDDQVYTLAQDSEGRTIVQFGDGSNGARLPTGTGNVVASYRTGMWFDALPANTLKVLRSKSSGLKSVANPQRIAAGGAPESPDTLRRRVAMATRTLGRIVSLSDYEDFCQGYPFIHRVLATPLSGDSGDVLHLSIATTDGEPVVPGDPLYDELVSAIATASGGRTRFMVQSVRRVPFRIQVSLRAEPGVRTPELEAIARDPLHARYAYGCTEFSQAIAPAQILAELAALPGVIASDLERFHRRSESAASKPVVSRLVAGPASWNDARRAACPAELLELDAKEDLLVRVELGE